MNTLINKRNLGVLLFIQFLLVGLFSCQSDSENTNEKNIQQSNSVVPLNNVYDLEQAVKEDSLNVQKILNLAQFYYSSKELDKALVQFMKVYNMDNKNLHALINIGNVNYDSGRNEQAIEFYTKALEIDPNNLNVRCDMATCVGMSGDLDNAIKLLNENIALNNTHPMSHHNLSVFLEKKGDKEGALKEMSIYNSLIK